MVRTGNGTCLEACEWRLAWEYFESIDIFDFARNGPPVGLKSVEVLQQSLALLPWNGVFGETEGTKELQNTDDISCDFGG